MEAGKSIKVEGKENNQLELIAKDPSFNLTREKLEMTMEPSKYVGRSQEQVEAFLADYIRPLLEENMEFLGMNVEVNV